MPKSFSWSIASAAVPTPTPTPGGGAQQPEGRGAGLRKLGLLRPFQRNGISDFASGSGPERWRAAVGQVLGTRCSSENGEGEVPWRQEFGSLMHLVKHRNNDTVTAELVRHYASDALSRWLPQVKVKEVTVQRRKDENNQLSILQANIFYVVLAQGTGQVLLEDTAELALQQ
jgi:phage baseplate assembly protein W